MSSSYQEVPIESFEPVETDRLIDEATLPFDVFVRTGSLTLPLFNRGTVYDAAARTVLRDRGIGTVHVRSGEAAELERYLSRPKPEGIALPDPETLRRYVQDKEAHYQIDRGLLIPGTSVTFPLFTLNDFRLHPLVSASERSPFVLDARTLAAAGDIVIRPADIPAYRDYLDLLLKSGPGPAKDRERIRRVVIKENSKLLLKDLIADPRSGEKIKQSISMVNSMVDAILENRDAASDMLTLRTYDYYTYTHSVNVSVLSVGLGVALGLPRDRLRNLGIGSMLHDVGKGAIPLQILNKTGKLDDDEFTLMRSHVQKGEEVLRVHKEIPEEAFNAVTQHHERLTGRGYPRRLTGAAVTLFGRMTSIIDCYDAITTTRSYQPAKTPFFALSVLTREAGDYDPDILAVFIKMLGELKTDA